jgi:5-methylthioribose kinase
MQLPVTPYLLLSVCGDKEQLDEETRDIIRTLFDPTKQSINIIFITPLKGSISYILRHLSRRLSGNAFVIVYEELTLSDLTTSSQEKLIEKSVKFWGSKISLKELVCVESLAAKFLSIVELFVGQLHQ